MKKFTLILIFLLIFLLTSCTRSANTTVNETSVDKLTKYYDIYTIALDSFISLDPGLNGDMKYIAIDSKCLRNASLEDKKAIFKYFEKYKVPVIDESFDSLKAKDMVKDGNFIEGILLTVENIEFKSGNEAIIDGSKFRSGLGAIGVKSIVKLKNGKWTLEKADMTWIS